MIYVISRFICALFYKCIFRLEVFGKTNIPKSGGFIIASNHVSYLDPIALGVACPRKISYMAKKELFRNPLFSKYLYSLRTFPVNRSHPDKSALKEAMRRLSIGDGLLLFPEGTRAQGGEPQAGVGFLAAKLNIPVIPAFVRGSDLALPKGAKFPRPKKISVHFGKQISIERSVPYHKIAQLVMDCIRHLSC